MWESFLPFFQWHDGCWLGERISGSVWMFPLIETIHILAMAIMFGGLLMLNLKMLGLTMPRQSLPLLSKTLMPFVNWGVVIMLISGYGMFASGPMKYYANDGFKVKMAALLLTLIFTLSSIGEHSALWVMHMESHNYPNGLVLKAFGDHVEGDVNEVNTLPGFTRISRPVRSAWAMPIQLTSKKARNSSAGGGAWSLTVGISVRLRARLRSRDRTG